MEIKLEIGEQLRYAIEEIAEKEGTEEDLGMVIQDAFHINFSKLIKEHAEGGDVRLEVKDAPGPDYKNLRCILAPLIGVKENDISNGHINTLITIAKGIFLEVGFHLKAVELESEINEEIKNVKKLFK